MFSSPSKKNIVVPCYNFGIKMNGFSIVFDRTLVLKKYYFEAAFPLVSPEDVPLNPLFKTHSTLLNSRGGIDKG